MAGAVSVFSDSDLLRAHSSSQLGPIGVNGIAFSRAHKSLLAVNTLDGTLIRIPVLSNGQAGVATVLANGLNGDGIQLDVKGNVYVALPFSRQIAVVSPEGTLLSMFTGAGDNVLRFPASLVFKGRTLYITNFAINGGIPGVSVMTARYPGAPLA